MHARTLELIGAAVSVSLGLAGMPNMASTSPKASGQQSLPSAAVQRQLVSVLIREEGGGQLGSGVLVGSATGGYWVATNQHVVQEHSIICVVTADRKAAGGIVWPRIKVGTNDSMDLALIWLPHKSKDPLLVASLREKQTDPRLLTLVLATGYPTPLQPQPDGPPYTENSGLLVPLLENPLQGGFDLSYTADVEKGMSGGGVFEGVELVGINGTHANPLWPGHWNRQDGKSVDDSLQQKLELVSLGISTGKIVKLLKDALPPNAETYSGSVDKLDCDANKRPSQKQGTERKY